ncbi:relE/StbE family addiction module toxin [Clostridium sp. CAG:524]|nr:relE/StbE family addiction module toxin [Clostridium sp. CAG:524]
MMMNYKIKYTKEFKKSIKKITKQGKSIDKLLNVIDLLSNKQQLDSKYKDHALYNDK